jgi:hypothetical protein
MSILLEFNKLVKESANRKLTQQNKMSFSAIMNPCTAVSTVNSNSVGGYNYGSTTTSNSYINITGTAGTTGIIGSDAFGQLTWNNNTVGIFDKPAINCVSNIIKDGLTREIVLCENREVCKEKYGSYGVKLFDSMLNEVLQLAIKSEENFNLQIQKENEKIIKLKDYITSHIGITKDTQNLFMSLMIS